MNVFRSCFSSGWQEDKIREEKGEKREEGSKNEEKTREKGKQDFRSLFS